MDGEEYVVINPDTLTDKEYFSYRDLQRLCCKLNIGGNGKREILEQKLKIWHRNRDRNDISKALSGLSLTDENTIPMPMNVPGNNFSLLQLDIKSNEKSMKSKKSNRRKSAIGLDNNGIVSPTLLRPLSNVNTNTTPNKSILKTSNNIENNTSARKFDKITFSPFNGVKVITNRVIQNKELGTHIRYDDLEYDNEDDGEYDEEEMVDDSTLYEECENFDYIEKNLFIE